MPDTFDVWIPQRAEVAAELVALSSTPGTAPDWVFSRGAEAPMGRGVRVLYTFSPPAAREVVRLLRSIHESAEKTSRSDFRGDARACLSAADRIGAALADFQREARRA